MTTQERIADFIAKRGPGGPNAELNEEQGAQQHFIELCAVLGVATPSGTDYIFEKANRGHGQRPGFADVFKRDCFAWENKAPGEKLDVALNQMMRYAMPLGNPPLFVVSDRLRIEVHTHFNGTPSECHEVHILELGDPTKRELLRRCFEDPESFRPTRTNRQITEEAAKAFAATAKRLRDAGIADHVTSHLLTQCVFCFFAESVRLLPTKPFWRLLNSVDGEAGRLKDALGALFASMRDGKMFGADKISWFNGGLFSRIEVPDLSVSDLAALRDAAGLDWSAIDPTIFGTLFERGLDPKKNKLIGARFTDTATIMRLIEPVIQRPLLAEWAQAKTRMSAHLERRDGLRSEAAAVPSTTPALIKKFGRMRTAANEEERKAQEVFKNYLERLRKFRVLDPACGSGNFLYLALRALKDIELNANFDAEALGLHREVDSYTGTSNVIGIELNEYAAELARVTVWIGELQWREQKGMPQKENPILDSLEHIECRDALLNADGSQAQWPEADVIVGNPPFVGNKKMRGEMGDVYVEAVRRAYQDNKLDGLDLVCFWFEKARMQMEAGKLQSAGLVSTNSIRGGANREVLTRVLKNSRIFLAWSDEEWWDNGTAVRVSMTGFGHNSMKPQLNGVEVEFIYSDLTADIDVTKAPKLTVNLDKSFQGVTPSAAVKRKLREELGLPDASFNLKGIEARRILQEPATISGEPMAAVVRPYLIADDITSRPLDRFIVNFVGRDEKAAAMFESPFAAIENVRLHRAHTNRFNDFQRYPWWQFGWPRPDMFVALAGLRRYISITRVSKHHLCVWTPAAVTPGDALVVVAREDDTTIGVLQSRIHEVWALRRGTSLGVGNDPRYTHTTCFETFPFPDGLTPDIPSEKYEHNEKAKAIATAAQELFKLREHYLNPHEWTDWVISPEEQAAGFPMRPVAKAGREADLKKRTLTNLYNQRPSWLNLAHETLDRAVAVYASCRGILS